MQVHDFIRKYANTRLSDRGVILNMNQLGLMNLNDIYREITQLEDEMRPKKIRIEKLLRVVQEFEGDSSFVIKLNLDKI